MNAPIKVPPAVLLARIARLESLVSGLQKQLADHKAVLDDLGRAFEIQRQRITGNANFAREHLRWMDERLLEVLDKVFPGHARTQLQIIDILDAKGEMEGKGEN